MTTDELVPWDGKEESLPQHIRALGKSIIPPAWTDVRIALDPNSELYVVGKDAKGRAQYRYSPDHVQRASSRKFRRVTAYLPHVSRVHEFIRSIEHDDVRDCLELIFRTGLRPGSQRETEADKNARGATTLRGENVILGGNRLQLEFIGKDGVFQSHRIVPRSLKENLTVRRKSAGENGLLYPRASDRMLRTALEPIGLHPKDLRTLLACRMARKLLAGRPPAKNKAEYVRVRNEVADAVAKRLGNTRSIALSSYIDPEIFAEWDPEGTRAYEAKKHSRRETCAQHVSAFDSGETAGSLAAKANNALARHDRSVPPSSEDEDSSYEAHHGYFDDLHHGCEADGPCPGA